MTHFTAFTKRLLAVALAIVLTVVALPATAEAAPVPTSDADPFYAVPAGLDALPNGTVVASRRIQALALGLPIPASAWQVKYKTIDQHSRPSAFVATLLVPLTGSGSRPLVSYQTAEDGVGSKCTPSYALRAGLAAGATNAALETTSIAQGVLRGYAVVVPDYQGPRSEFTGATGTAHGILDGIRAARNFTPAGIDRSAPVGLIGYSGGALASAWALHVQPSYAPELSFAGAALGGVVANLTATVHQFDRLGLGGAIAVVLAGLDRSYPEAHIQQYLNSAGRQAIAASHSDCVGDALLRHPLATLASWGVRSDSGLFTILDRISPLNYPGKPRTPVLLHSSLIDELAPATEMRRLAARYCAAGVPVQRTESLAGEHAVYAVAGIPRALDYLTARFTGQRPPSNC